MPVLFFLVSLFRLVMPLDMYANDAAQEAIHIRATQVSQEKMKLLVGVVKEQEGDIITLAHAIKRLLEYSYQRQMGFSVTLEFFKEVPSKKDIKHFFDKGFAIGLFISTPEQKTIEWRLYEMRDASMIQGKKFLLGSLSLARYAEKLADEVWPLLTQQDGIFSTRIAFCKEIQAKGKKIQKQLCVTTPYDTTYQKVLVTGTNVFAPRWNENKHNPLILYSESTRKNVRLMSVNLEGSRAIVSNLDGINMLPSFNGVGDRVVCCFSMDGNSQLYLIEPDPLLRLPKMKQITYNQGNNISPILCENGDIIFCSDFEGVAKIYRYYASSGHIETLINDNHSYCPSLCKKNNKLAYIKPHKGIMQIFAYDLISKQEHQITFDDGNKEECTWSPCGNYMAFSVEKGVQSRIAVINLATKDLFYVTDAKEYCCYPSWSPSLA